MTLVKLIAISIGVMLLGAAAAPACLAADGDLQLTRRAARPGDVLPLMGVSSLGYLAGKVVRKPGPIIRQLVPPPPYAPGAQIPGGIRIVGENLSPRAMVWINRQLIPPGSVTVPPVRAGAMEQSAAMEFVTDLLVDAGAVARALGPPAAVPAPVPGPAPAAVAPAPAPAVALPPPPVGPAAVAGGVAVVRVVNPDGQSAEI